MQQVATAEIIKFDFPEYFVYRKKSDVENSYLRNCENLSDQSAYDVNFNFPSEVKRTLKPWHLDFFYNFFFILTHERFMVTNKE